MMIEVLKSKLHCVKVTEANLNYMGSITIDEELIEGLITEKTVAIVPVHVYGNICNVEKIDEIAKKHNLKVIYDAAHAFGVKKDGKTYVSKNFSVSEFFANSKYSSNRVRLLTSLSGRLMSVGTSFLYSSLKVAIMCPIICAACTRISLSLCASSS